jgi:hypothetical protein
MNKKGRRRYRSNLKFEISNCFTEGEALRGRPPTRVAVVFRGIKKKCSRVISLKYNDIEKNVRY